MTEMTATDAILALEDDLAAAVQTARERTAAVLALHYECTLTASLYGIALGSQQRCHECDACWPCPTARAVGVTDE